MHTDSRRGGFGFARLSTSQKLILVLTLALMPLGAVALIVSLSSARTADSQRRADLQVAATEAARKLGAELTSDIIALRAAVTALELSNDARDPCARLNALLPTNPLRRVPAALYGPGSAPVCASPVLGAARPSLALDSVGPVIRRTGDGFDVIVALRGGRYIAVARYSAQTLARFARPSGFNLPYRLTVDADGGTIKIADSTHGGIFERNESTRVPVGVEDLQLDMTVRAAPFGVTEALLALLPLLMWAAAVGVGYYVVDRFLVRPLKHLRAAVGSYVPGSSRLVLSETPATEIRDLEASFAGFADRLADRERDLETGLADQVKLTREVHHRVKNNLQVIASLISLHARGNVIPDAQAAYAAIQRRVDALAIVHRNHYAELERNLGIDVRTLIGELVANFQANAGLVRSAPTVMMPSSALCVSQDVATPLAFLFTELTEMALLADTAAPIKIGVAANNDSRSASMTVAATSLAQRAVPAADPSLRIIEALARQLRSSLDYDAVAGRYAVSFPLFIEAVDN